MLREISIRNLAVVEDAVIRFDGGLNALTGSTGAGKSIILAAVDLLSGGRARRSLIRAGADAIVVEGVFAVPRGVPLRDRLGMEDDDETISLRREVTTAGRSRIWVNGILSTNAHAAGIVGSLLELHGQRRQQELLDPSTHIAYLDARSDYGDLLSQVRGLSAEFHEARSALRDLEREAEAHRSQEDFLRFQLTELDGLGIEEDTARSLEGRIAILANRHRYIEILGRAATLLEGEEGSIIGGLDALEDLLGELAALDARWTEGKEEVAAARIAMREIGRAVERAGGDAEEEPEDLEALQGRLASIQRVERKHGLDCAGLVAKRDELRRILSALDDGSMALEAAERRVGEAARRLEPRLDELSAARKRAAKELDREVTRGLVSLGMKGALFKTEISQLENSAFHGPPYDIHLSPDGRDRVEFLIRTNVGEDVHPLAEVASGGELSRVTLVLKSLQAETRAIPTLVFDEIDAGLGADLGGVVAGRMRELAGRYQIVVITHLPQVAALASRHVRIEKRVREGRTIAIASALEREERIGEIARMLGGPGELRERLAAEMLEETIRARSSAG
ncbi:MAG: DNA repair protein RecN [Candidatus Krumholzibacteriota bacterium]|nr:DNA repair protein RecN [Candidatus Krumholzibacteriota bacterium]